MNQLIASSDWWDQLVAPGDRWDQLQTTGYSWKQLTTPVYGRGGGSSMLLHVKGCVAVQCCRFQVGPANYPTLQVRTSSLLKISVVTSSLLQLT